MYVRELTVLPSDASCHGELKLRGLLNYLQDTASLAVSELEGSPTQVLARGYAWVLLGYEVELLRRMPALDERFVVAFRAVEETVGANGYVGPPLTSDELRAGAIPLTRGRMGRRNHHIAVRVDGPLSPHAKKAISRVK